MDPEVRPLFIHVAAGCYPPSVPLLVSHPLRRCLPTWFRWGDLFGPITQRGSDSEEHLPVTVVRDPVAEGQLWS